MSIRIVTRTVSLTLTGIVAGCLFPTDSCSCVPPPPTAIVYGTIKADADPVANAEVKVTGTGVPDSIDPFGVGVTSANGRYRFRIDSRLGYGPLLVRVAPDAASGLGPHSVTFDPPWSHREPPDSIRVDVELNPL